MCPTSHTESPKATTRQHLCRRQRIPCHQQVYLLTHRDQQIYLLTRCHHMRLLPEPVAMELQSVRCAVHAGAMGVHSSCRKYGVEEFISVGVPVVESM